MHQGLLPAKSKSDTVNEMPRSKSKGRATRDDIRKALDAKIDDMAESSAAGAWSTPGDQELDEYGDSLTIVARFGNEDAVQGDVLVDREWEKRLGLEPLEHPRLWSEVGTRGVEDWLEQNGYEIVPGGGRIPSDEQEVSVEHAIYSVADDLGVSEDAVQKVADAEKLGELAYTSVSGNATWWVKQ